MHLVTRELLGFLATKRSQLKSDSKPAFASVPRPFLLEVFSLYCSASGNGGQESVAANICPSVWGYPSKRHGIQDSLRVQGPTVHRRAVALGRGLGIRRSWLSVRARASEWDGWFGCQRRPCYGAGPSRLRLLLTSDWEASGSLPFLVW